MAGNRAYFCKWKNDLRSEMVKLGMTDSTDLHEVTLQSTDLTTSLLIVFKDLLDHA